MAPARPETRSDSPVLQALERHQHRRDQGIPTLTVLAGPHGLAVSLWKRWLATHQRVLCTSLATMKREALRAWVDTLAQARDLEADAAGFLGAAAGLAPGELPRALKGKTAHERKTLLDTLLPAAPGGDVTAVCRCLLHPQVLHKSGVPLEALLAACEHNAGRVLVALHTLLPAGTAPALLLAGQGPEWLARAAHSTARLCAAVPSLLIALAVDAPTAKAYLRGHESQAQAMVHEGLLELEAPSPQELEQRLKKLGVQKTEALASSLARLAADGVSEELLESFGAAARERESEASSTQEGKARSKAEQFLYELLQAWPATHGLFTLNQQAEFRIHDRPVEVDFLSQRLRVAIEVDGYYHFREADNYRRDRRKDLALQRHGYLVLRFLADDVVERLEEIRDTVFEVISQRREAPGGSPPSSEGADGGE